MRSCSDAAARSTAEIARVRAGEFTVLDDAAQRDRYQQFVATARSLLGDLREVEENFRALDRRVRERIAAWQGSKGELLDEIVGGRHAISGSDQGRSFDAFYDFLLSMRRQEEFTDLLERVQTLDAIGQVDQRIARVQHDWLNAAGRTQATVRLLSEQLRRFLDDQAWLENRRVMDVLRSIEAHALVVRDGDISTLTTSIDDTKVEVVLPMERPLYQPRARHAVDSQTADGPTEQVDMSALFEQVYVDPARLIAAVRDVLREQSQVPLRDVVGRHPLKEGLAELVAYLSLDDGSFTVIFDEARRESIAWTYSAGGRRTVTGPDSEVRPRGGGERPVTPPDTQGEPSLSVAVTQLMKGVVYRDNHTEAWHHLSALQPHVRDHVAVLGLVVVVDESEGYAYLESRPEDPDLPPVLGWGLAGPCRFTSASSWPYCAANSPRQTPVAPILGLSSLAVRSSTCSRCSCRRTPTTPPPGGPNRCASDKGHRVGFPTPDEG